METNQETTKRADLRIVPANQASGEDLEKIFGTRGDAGHCQCQWFQNPGKSFNMLTDEERANRLRTQTACGHPKATNTSGLVGYLEGEPVGWCAIEPRTAYPRLRTSKVPWSGRDEDKDSQDVWAAVCFVTRTGYRRMGVSRAMAVAAVAFARDRGASAVEGYPILLPEGKRAMWGEMYVGSRSIFEEAGFTEVSHPTPRRLVMRIDFEGAR
ncbi:GNAT family N-acetyltransferase [Paeniglutamicibacter sulfureus]|jgi:GNAT superfamily N-acetyltransferase|uniref:GNAT family N-acetyltransferase n=1 Tax=Paeniglutamicibacter sulfureus TaxID=43666 RepID=UPI002664FE05|nr:GNAT family N-acetyltransferase [Paeniglutamicibacter sulfureus]MDO2934765.1 GNAT family N-acetyltransferase [Paeniglutamicibacter sulfureus]